MSDSERPERTAFRELETLVRHLADELGAFRRRALTAEAKLRDVEGRAPGEAPDMEGALARVDELERQNAELAARLEQATVRAQQMLERVRFLRQQARTGAER